MDKPFLDDLAGKIARILPPMPENVALEIEQSLRSLLNKAFDKAELVTREEFEIQTAVLQKTRLKLEVMEKKLAELETQLNVK